MKSKVIAFLAAVLVICFSVYAVAETEEIQEEIQAIKQKAEQGDAEAQFMLGVMYYNGVGVPQDYKKAFEWYTKAAEQGDAEAQYNLGVMYYNGEGVPQDYKKAFEWFTKAAEQGLAEAQFMLGVMYDKGEGVPQNYEKAYMWFSLSAVQGDKDAPKNRDLIAKEMTPEQISQGQEMARQWWEKHRQKSE